MRDIKTILMAVDFSETAPKVADYGRYFCEKTGARLVVLYVSPALRHYGMFQVSPEEIETFAKSILDGANDTMTRFIHDNLGGVDATGRVEMGYAAEAIIEIAREIDADMIMMGTHGRKGVDRMFFGSVAEKVVKRADAPVMTIRP